MRSRSLVTIVCALALTAATGSTALSDRIGTILARPEFKHAMFGIEIYSLDESSVVYALNADRFFVPGSTTKLVTMGSALHLLGADYRFHTRVYRTGEVSADGTLRGDLVLEASGDPNLSGRIRPGDKLAFENMDHSYGGLDSHGLEGDPIGPIRAMAGAVASRGIKTISGRVIVDHSLYKDGERDGGTGFVISPIIVNDNAIDIIVHPGATEGAPVALAISPTTAYARFDNELVTGKVGSALALHVDSDVVAGDGSRTVRLKGTVPVGSKPVMWAYRVPEPARFAEFVLTEALHERGIVAAARRYEDAVDRARIARLTTPDHVVAEHVSPPFSEEVKVTLKVSQNLHASATPFLLGALKAHTGTAAAGFGEMEKFLKDTGIDVSGASQSDGAGADAHFTPAFMVSYLTYLARQPDAALVHDALPVLGRDGTLWNILPDSPAAGMSSRRPGPTSSAICCTIRRW